MNRIPTLDGWRGIAILLVLADHIQNALLDRFIRPWARLGQHGVTIFFILSGFLITSKLLEGPIDLKSFYIRRFFRLMPAAWLYLAVLILIGQQVHATIVAPSAVLASLFFYRNYVLVPLGATTWHFWSLSLEEQFYLIWPCILLLAGARRSLWIAAAGAAACAVYRLQHWAFYNRDFYNCHSQVRADALLVGCGMALLLANANLRPIAIRWAKIWWIPALVGLVYCVSEFTLLPPFIECICIALLIAASMFHPKMILASPLMWRPLSQLGLISYSIYIWQEPFMLVAKGNGLGGAFLLFVVMPLIAFLSYEYLERPCIRLGHRITRPSALKTTPMIEVSR
jgi:peptidoglycan/LPS O-acetylase OafA/YrhL